MYISPWVLCVPLLDCFFAAREEVDVSVTP
jgi:hypothetical protein